MASSDRKRERQNRETGGGPNTVTLLVGAIIVAAVGWVAYSVSSGPGAETVTMPIEVEGLDDNATLTEMAQGVTYGDPDAPISIVEFGDLQCPACAAFHVQVKPQIERNYVDEGIAKFVFYDFPLVGGHPHAFLAARATRCAQDQDLYWEYQDLLFVRQSQWSLSSSPPVSPFEDYAAEVGLDEEEFSGCLRSDRHAALVTANMTLGQRLGVGGTPTLFVSRGADRVERPTSNLFDGIQEAVEKLLAADATSGGTEETSGEGGI